MKKITDELPSGTILHRVERWRTYDPTRLTFLGAGWGPSVFKAQVLEHKDPTTIGETSNDYARDQWEPVESK